MVSHSRSSVSIAMAAVFTFGTSATMALAQEPPAAPVEEQGVKLGHGTPRNDAPIPRPEGDEQPPPPAPSVPVMGVSRQAGTGGQVAYARAGVLELGGSGGFAAANNYRRFEVTPSVGWFIVDNVELSLLGGVNYFDLDGTNGMPGVSATELKALVEPSFHLPFSDTVFGFVGLGAGVNYVTGQSAGFAVQPRLGANFLVGRSGMLTPSLTVAYSTVDALRTPAGTVLAVQTSYGMNIGYTVMW